MNKPQSQLQQSTYVFIMTLLLPGSVFQTIILYFFVFFCTWIARKSEILLLISNFPHIYWRNPTEYMWDGTLSRKHRMECPSPHLVKNGYHPSQELIKHLALYVIILFQTTIMIKRHHITISIWHIFFLRYNATAMICNDLQSYYTHYV